MYVYDYISTLAAILVLGVYIFLGMKKSGIAVITAPFISIAMLVVGLVDELGILIVISPILTFGTLLAVLISSHEPEKAHWPRTFAKWVFIIFGSLALLIVIGVASGPFGIFGAILFFGLIAFFISYALTSRHATAVYVISTIGSSMRQNLPLPMALETAASGQMGESAKYLRGIRKWLVEGYSLSESIKRGYPRCPGYALGMITAAEKIDQLPAAIRTIEEDMAVKSDERRKIRPVHPLYPIILLFVMFFIVLGMMTFVIPKFYTVLQEMTDDAQLPLSTRILTDIMQFVNYEYGWVIAFTFLIVCLFLVPYLIRVKFRPRRPGKPYFISRIGDFVKWHIPVLHWFEQNYSLVQLTGYLRVSLLAGNTVNDSIAGALVLDMNNCFRKRLRSWLGMVEAGDNIASAVRRCKLSNSLAWAFDEQVNRGNTPTVLGVIEDFHRSNYGYRINLARFIFWPCVTIVMGLMVAFIVYALFSPGILIITNLAESVTP